MPSPTGVSDCIEWDGARLKTGYVWISEIRELAHRHVWRECFGEIPRGHDIHHSCRNKRCSNPEHLRCLTRKDHAQAHQDERTHCKRGHSYAIFGRVHVGTNNRYCRVCENANKRRRGDNGSYWRKRKAEREAAELAEPAENLRSIHPTR